ncbi:PRC-barrel domain-containing protein [Bacillus sp. FJAT-45350]|uniref:PRC-barrel domain-containing protein n=1 Tax=Bacillus sp. FJAT-45350 TaxID=2011014 RepID=UPI000BB91E19|nr:PRC-barrel domain-containing protein [Bacillus sp. FJAT-45350]
MFLYENLLRRFTVMAKDGEVGKIDDFYFEDEKWTVRYIVVNTIPWFPGGKVLLSPISVEKVNIEDEIIYVELTKEQVKNSPDIDFARPVSKQMELDYHHYFGYPYYWSPLGVWGHGSYARDLATLSSDYEKEYVDTEVNHHLRSVKEITGAVTGYGIFALDDEFGQVKDMIIEDKTWTIRYFMVDTVKWLPSRNVIIAKDWIEEINWSAKHVRVNITKDEVKNSPEFFPDQPIDRKYEKDIYDFYRRKNYWE